MMDKFTHITEGMLSAAKSDSALMKEYVDHFAKSLSRKYSSPVWRAQSEAIRAAGVAFAMEKLPAYDKAKHGSTMFTYIVGKLRYKMKREHDKRAS